MEKPCVDNNQPSFWLLDQQNLHLKYHHPIYSFNLATQVVTGAFVQFLLKSGNPILTRSYPWPRHGRWGWPQRQGVRKGFRKSHPAAQGIELLPQGMQQRREESIAVRRAQIRSLLGCVHQIFPSRIRDNSPTPDSLKALAPNNGTIEGGEGTENWERGSLTHSILSVNPSPIALGLLTRRKVITGIVYRVRFSPGNINMFRPQDNA